MSRFLSLTQLAGRCCFVVSVSESTLLGSEGWYVWLRAGDGRVLRPLALESSSWLWASPDDIDTGARHDRPLERLPSNGISERCWTRESHWANRFFLANDRIQNLLPPLASLLISITARASVVLMENYYVDGIPSDFKITVPRASYLRRKRKRRQLIAWPWVSFEQKNEALHLRQKFSCGNLFRSLSLRKVLEINYSGLIERFDTQVSHKSLFQSSCIHTFFVLHQYHFGNSI